MIDASFISTTIYFITILSAHRDRNDSTQTLPAYEVFSLALHNNYNIYTYRTEHAQLNE